MAIPFPSPSPISICLPVRPDTGGPQAWAVQYYYNVLVLGGPDRMRLGAHGPGAWSKSWAAPTLRLQFHLPSRSLKKKTSIKISLE